MWVFILFFVFIGGGGGAGGSFCFPLISYICKGALMFCSVAKERSASVRGRLLGLNLTGRYTVKNQCNFTPYLMATEIPVISV